VADLNNLRILWSSNAPWGKTGYGNQTALFYPRIKALGHALALLPFWGLEGGAITIGDVPVYPKMRDGYGNDAMGPHAQHFEADIIITLIDAWVMNPKAIPDGIAWCPWFPIDMFPFPPAVLRTVQHAFQPIVYSRFGERMAHDANLDVRYVPHGVDTAVFSPGDKAAARVHLGWTDDQFIFGMVAANKGWPSRKALDRHLEAFGYFAKKHPDAHLYIHTNDGSKGEQGGVNLPELAEFYEVADRVSFPDQYGNTGIGFPDMHMAELYRAFDCLLSVSMGEGFGVPILEAQACGCPVIVGDWTSMSELCFGGWTVPPPGRTVSGYGWVPDRTWMPVAAYQVVPRTSDILEAMERAYSNPIALAAKAKAAAAGALAYDADVVTAQHWRPVLDEIAVRLGKGRRALPAPAPMLEEVLS